MTASAFLSAYHTPKFLLMNIADVNNDGIAMDGFDPVAYYNNEPLRGTEEFTAQVEDLTFWFNNKNNLELFLATPDKYMPNSGGLTGNASSVATDDTQFFQRRGALEDARVSMDTAVPIDTMQDGSVEMQNLNDDEN